MILSLPFSDISKTVNLYVVLNRSLRLQGQVSPSRLIILKKKITQFRKQRPFLHWNHKKTEKKLMCVVSSTSLPLQGQNSPSSFIILKKKKKYRADWKPTVFPSLELQKSEKQYICSFFQIGHCVCNNVKYMLSAHKVEKCCYTCQKAMTFFSFFLSFFKF